MSNEMVTLDLTQLPSTQIGSDDAFAALAKGGGDWLRYIKLCSNDKYAKTRKIPAGHWGIPGTEETIEDLGPSIDVLPLARRPKALDMSDKTAIVTSYDEQSEVVQGHRCPVDGKRLFVPIRHQFPRPGALNGPVL